MRIKIFEIFICSEMIGDKASPESRAVKAAKWTCAHLFSAIYFVVLKLLWVLFEVKVGEMIFYLLLSSAVLFSWITLNGYYFDKISKAKKVVQSTYSEHSIKCWGRVGAFIIFIAPLSLLIIGITLINSYKNW